MSGRYEKTFSWTKEAVEDLRRMWCEERASASMIADALSYRFGDPISRSAVIGKVHRLKFVQASKPASLKKSLKQSIPDNKKSNPVVKSIIPTVKEKLMVAPVVQEIRVQIPDNANPISLTDLRETTCRFPIGDPRDEGFGFCGAPSPFAGSPYCAFHQRIAYVPQQKAAPRKTTDPRGMRRIQMTAF